MKLVSLQKNLKQAIFAVSHITGKNNNLPILNNLMISAENGLIKFITTNLEIGITSLTRGKVEEDGAFTVEAKILADYINLLPNQKINLELKNDNLLVNCENYKTKIKGQGIEEYPLIPQLPRENYYSLDINALKLAISQVIFAVAGDENRLELSGCLFVLEKEQITVVGTDSYRLAEKKIKVSTNYGEMERKIIIPTKTLQELARILSGDFSDETTMEVKLFLSENQILFAADNVEIISRLIDGQYPDYKQIIPTNPKTTAIINRQELIRAVKAASIFSKTGINDINLDFVAKDNKLMITAISGLTGENETALEINLGGADNSITINYRYLLDGLNNIDSEFVKLEVIDGNTPCILRPDGEKVDDYLYIIMPIKK